MDERSKEFRENIEGFVCQRCNECCRQPGFVYLQDGEPEAIADHLGISVRQFADDFCDLQDRRRIVLKKHPSSEDCIFLTEKGCSVHAAKPGQCKDFPVRWRTPNSFKYCAGLKILFP